MVKRFQKFIFIVLAKVLIKSNTFLTLKTKKQEILELIKDLMPIYPGIKLIRMGPVGDGGYLLPDDLNNIEACFSPGVCHISGFEKDCANRGMKVFMADKSVDGPAESHPLFHFTKKFIGARKNNDFITLDEWVSTSLSESKSDLLLQMDIEGCEYETILSTSHYTINRFRVIIIEFHHLAFLWSEPFFQIASSAFEKLLETHICVHIHPNNRGVLLKAGGLEIPNTMEFTFIRKDRILKSSNYNHFPHPLDCDNINQKSIILPKVWYDSN